MSQRRGGLAESLLRMGSGGGGGVSGERAGRAGGGGDEPSEAAASSSAAADATANSTSTSATATAANIFNPTGTVSSNESTPRMQHAIVGSPFPFVLRQHSHHHKRHGEAHAPATTTTGFAAPPPPPVSSSTLSAAASLEEPLLSGEVPHAAATAAAVPEAVDLEAGTRDGVRRAAGAGAAGTGQQRQQQQQPSAAVAAAAAAPVAAGPSANASARSRGSTSTSSKNLATALVYGAINALVGLPTLVSFSIIVYGTRAVYRPYLPDVAKLAFLASAVHQAVFCALSSLPFAVAQAQDTPLIILAAIAGGVADECAKVGASAAATAATALATLAAATFLVGLALVAFGALKAASFVQYLPLPCVGGYLAFVGFFVSIAGLNLSVNADLATAAGWASIFSNPTQFAQLAACLACTGMFLLVLRRCSHPAALPAAIVAVPAAFYLALAAAGASLADAAEAGWTLPAAPAKPWWSVYELFDPEGDGLLRGIVVSAGVSQIPKFVVLFAVVAFGSCLDVAAIASSSEGALDFDRELKTVGVANVAAGAIGAGFTGSYIFSQTIFSMNNGVRSAAMGLVIVAAELAAFFSSVSVVPLFPLCLFGSLLTLFGVEILMDWLVHSREKVGGGAEYLLLWGTFISIVVLGLERGVAAGLFLCIAQFSFAYARVSATASHVAPSRAGAARPPAQRDLLAHFSRHRAAIALSGVIFFGSAFAISERALEVAAALAADADEAAHDAEEGSVRGGTGALQALAEGAGGAGGGGASSSPRSSQNAPVSKELAAALAAAPRFLLLDFRGVRGVDATAASAFASLARRLASQDESVPGKRRVTLIVCHLTSKKATRLLAAHGFELRSATATAAAAALSSEEEEGGGAPSASSSSSSSSSLGLTAYPSMDDAVFATEEAFLAAARRAGAIGSGSGGRRGGGGGRNSLDGLIGGGFGPFSNRTGLEGFGSRISMGGGGNGATAATAAAATTRATTTSEEEAALLAAAPATDEDLLADALRAVCAAPEGLLPRGDADAAAAAPFLTTLSLGPGQSLFARGEPADAIFIVLRGVVELRVDYLATADDAAGSSSSSSRRMLSLPAELRAASSTPRSFFFGPGAVVGTMDFFGGDGPGAPRRGSAAALPPRGAVVGALSRSRFQEMAVAAPAAAAALLGSLLRAEVLGNIHSLEVLEAAAAVARA